MVDKSKYQIGSRGYNYERMNYPDYVKKYYNIVPEDWIWLMTEIVEKAFNTDKREDFLKKNAFRKKSFNFNLMEDYYKNIKDDIRFEEDIKKFISYLAGDGFFESINNPSFETWIRSENVDMVVNRDKKEHSIFEHINLEYGMNAIRSKIVNSNWFQYR